MWRAAVGRHPPSGPARQYLRRHGAAPNLAGAAADVHKDLALAGPHHSKDVGEAPRIHFTVGVRPKSFQNFWRRQDGRDVTVGVGGSVGGF